jgi:mono/diheme cytochrome c family protein
MFIRLLGLALLLGSGGCERPLGKDDVDGARIFKTACSRCHGEEGVPNPSMVARIGVKPLNSDRVADELTDADIRKQVLKGSSNKQMPAFAGALTDPQIQAVIDHVRGLRAATSPATAPSL